MTRPDPGYVYLVESPARGLWKLGMTRAIRPRLLALLAEHGPIRPAGIIRTNGCRRLERYLAGVWADRHAGNEWYALSDADAAPFRTVRLVNWSDLPPVPRVDADATLNPPQALPAKRLAYRIRLGELLSR